MSLKSYAAKIFAGNIAGKTAKWAKNPIATQEKVFRALISRAKDTAFGKDHHFSDIYTHQDFIKNVPIRDYEECKTYIERVVAGEKDILWPGKPAYFAKTSGTTSGVKYIPITKESIKYQIEASRNAILSYIHETENADFVVGKMIFLQGSAKMKEKNVIMVCRLSGISAQYLPGYLQNTRLPSWETNRLEECDTNVNAIVEETLNENMILIAGMRSWIPMYIDILNAASGQKNEQLLKI